MKKVLVGFVASMLLGFALHQTIHVTKRLATKGWQTIVGHVIGVEGTFPVFIADLRESGASDEEIRRASVAFQTSFLKVGLGVAFAYFVDLIFSITPES